MHERMMRLEVQILRRGRPPQDEVARLTGVALRAIRRIEAQDGVAAMDSALERRGGAV